MKREIKISSPLANAILVRNDGRRHLAKIERQGRPKTYPYGEWYECKDGTLFRLVARLRSGVAVYHEAA